MSKRLCLSHNKKISGVCGGVAEYFDLDYTIVRLITVFLILLLRWPIVIAYVTLWIVMPESNDFLQ